MMIMFMFVVLGLYTTLMFTCKRDKSPKVKDRIVGKSILLPENEETDCPAGTDDPLKTAIKQVENKN
uniref:Conserved domain protein n=1 Tax=Haemonchus contortus TaxID=6289 RepID=A0A7I4YVV0_HAECO